MKKHKKPYRDLTGQRFGRLIVISLIDCEAGANIPTKWLCKCDCGNEIEVTGSNIKSGNTTSCGCKQKEIAKKIHYKHGETGTRLFVIWVHMKQRCFNPNDKAYKYYGERGIKVCEEWANNFKTFSDWAISNGYSDELTIDRINVNGNYEPSNCQWITIQEQQRNKRDNTKVLFNGYCRTVGEWAKEFNCSPSTVYKEILKREKRVFYEA